ncbi:hypothetical protein HAX54_048995, partial [Datura stramonium]|nr:hypothetical protein [Datura stramonium]
MRDWLKKNGVVRETMCDGPVGFGWVEMEKKRGRSGGEGDLVLFEVVRDGGGEGCCFWP